MSQNLPRALPGGRRGEQEVCPLQPFILSIADVLNDFNAWSVFFRLLLAGLFTKEFYGSCYKALHEDGIMVYQHGSPFFDEDEETCRAMHKKAYRSFPISRVYQAHIPTCPAGYWLFGFASKKYHPIKDFDPKRWNKRGIKTWYYTTHLHRGAFMLPRYVEDLLKEEED